MFQLRNRFKQLLYSSLFISLWIHTVGGQNQESRLDILKGNNGEPSCTLKANIYTGCKSTPPSIFNATFETPASCTCNKEFFNIWSACSYSTGENLFPLYKDWMSTCLNSGINLVQAQVLADRNTWGVDAPKWARIDVPGNLTMDLQTAVLVTRSNWSGLQILLPFITAFVAVFLTILMMQLYHSRSRPQTASWRDRVHRLVRPIPRVKNVEKYESWEIEANDGGQYELVTPQNSAAVSDAYAFGPKSDHQIQAQHQPLHRGGHRKTDSDVDDTASAWGSLRNMRMPWNKGPNRVQEVLATTEFDIDDYNASSATVGLTSDGESMYSPRRSVVHEGDDSSAGQVGHVNPQPGVGKDDLSYSDPFSEQRSHR